jgi:hypothetical protein
MDTFWVTEPGEPGGAGVARANAGLAAGHGLPVHHDIIQGIVVIVLVPDDVLRRKVQSLFMRIVMKQMGWL